MHPSDITPDTAIDMTSATTGMEVDDRPTLLVVDDDVTFCTVLANAMTKTGIQRFVRAYGRTGIGMPRKPARPNLPLSISGCREFRDWPWLKNCKALDPGTRIVMLTGYASIATAVEAIKLGATHYLAKPVDVDEIMMAFERTSGDADVQNQRTSAIGGPA